MPVVKCSNGKFRIGDGPCVYETREKAEKAMRAMYAEESSDNPGYNSKTVGGVDLSKKNVELP